MYNIGSGDGEAMVPHFYWTILARKQDTLIEQSATQSITLIEQSLYASFKTLSNCYYDYILKVSEILFQSF